MINTSWSEPSGLADTAEGAVITLNLRGLADSSKAAASGNKPGLFCRRANSPLALVAASYCRVRMARHVMCAPLSARSCPHTTWFEMLAASLTAPRAWRLGVTGMLGDAGSDCGGGSGWDVFWGPP